MTVRPNDIIGLRQTFRGDVVMPGDAGFDEARAVWNGAIDRRPAIVARCQSTQDVVDAVRFARTSQLEIAVRGGGHNYAGHGVCDNGIMIHLGDMKGVTVDVERRRVTCGGGATWGDVDAATQVHGLATPGGFISHTGVAGLTLGGGIGWLTRKAGLSCDNLTSAEVVTADGRVLRASVDEHPDLFWALRGGGGNFGVVTSFEFALHEVGPMVHLALLFWGLEAGTDALKRARSYVAAIPDNTTAFIGIGLSAPLEPFVPEAYRGKVGHALIIVGFASAEEHAAAVAAARDGVAPLFEFVTPIPFVALQQMFNGLAQWGTHAYEKALYLDEFSDAALDVIAEFAPKKSSPLSFSPTFTLDGAYRAVGESDTAFGGSRRERFVFNIEAALPSAAGFMAERAWVREFWAAMRPHASNAGGYINFMSESEEDRVRASYGPAKYDRLSKVKAEYDPENLLHLNVNVRPAK